MKQALLLVLMAIFMFSCKDDDEAPPATPEIDFTTTAEDWYPLSVGSYWIYQWYNKDSTGQVSFNANLDSIYIEKDTLINGLSYFKIIGQTLSPNDANFIRQKDEFLINHLGEILFNSQQTDSLLNTVEDQYFISELQMVGDTIVNFEIGLLNCKYQRQDITWLNGISECTLPSYHYWGKGIGPVRREAYFASNCSITGHELIRYHLK